jgi:hypothetical protein
VATLTDRQAVRLRIGDDGTILSDDEVDYFLTENDSNVLLASAGALRAIAASTSHVAQLLKRGNLTMDRKAVPGHLMKLADTLEAQDESEPATASAEMSVGPFAAAQIVANAALRGTL